MESCVLYCADKVVPVEGDKGAAGVAIETTVATAADHHAYLQLFLMPPFLEVPVRTGRQS